MSSIAVTGGGNTSSLVAALPIPETCQRQQVVNESLGELIRVVQEARGGSGHNRYNNHYQERIERMQDEFQRLEAECAQELMQDAPA